MVLLDTRHRILGTRTVYQGSVNQKKYSTGTNRSSTSTHSFPDDLAVNRHGASDESERIWRRNGMAAGTRGVGSRATYTGCRTFIAGMSGRR